MGDEIADVLLYLLQLADCTGIDVEQALEDKLRKNAQKYPAKHPEESKQNPKVHLLIDWENVQPKGAELHGLVPDGSDVWLFHGPEQKVDASSHRQTYGPSKVTLVPRSGAGKNALDFQLSYYMGYISARQPEGQFVVVSNDKGYDAMLEHAQELGFDAKRCEFRRAPTPPMPVPTQLKASSEAPTVVVRVKAKAPLMAKPQQLASTPVAPLIAPVAPAPVSTTAAAPIETTLCSAPRQGVAAIKKPVAVSKTAPTKPVAKKPATPNKTGPAVKKIAAPHTVAQVAQHVLASLKKMPDNKPTRHTGLLKLIQTHITPATNQTVTAEQVCTLLKKQKHLALSQDGLKVMYPQLPPSGKKKASSA